MTTPNARTDAQQAAQRGDWAAVRQTLEGVEDLPAEASDTLAEACWWLDDPLSAIAAWERAYTIRLADGDNLGASRTAVRIAREYALALATMLQPMGGCFERTRPCATNGRAWSAAGSRSARRSAPKP